MAAAEQPRPGRGANHLESSPAPSRAYVYAVRSRRSGGVSIGVDLTPAGACPLACDYCQVPREARVTAIDRVDLARLRIELVELLADLDARGERPVDVCFAGSGEPTWSPNFAAALEVAIDVAARRVPVRVLTSGATLDWERVQGPLADLVAREVGEVWIKLDAWDEPTIAHFWGSRGQRRHEERAAHFARTTPIFVQTMLAERDGGPSLDDTVAGLRGAIARLLEDGAQIRKVILTTMHRPAGTPSGRVRAYDDDALARVADAIRPLGLAVSVAFSSPRDQSDKQVAQA